MDLRKPLVASLAILIFLLASKFVLDKYGFLPALFLIPIIFSIDIVAVILVLGYIGT